MGKLYSCLLLAFILLPQLGIGQEKDSAFYSNGFVCGTDFLIQSQRQSETYQKVEAEMNRRVAGFVRLQSEDTVVLPVVVHVISKNPNNIPNKEIINGITKLNNTFARRGLPWTAGKGVDTKIRFGLARKDPDGGNSTGITRTTTFWGDQMNPPMEDARLKALTQWDPARYINIWLVESLGGEGSADFECGTWNRSPFSGYATMPFDRSQQDGIVITQFDFYLAHEMGHYLGLYHTYEEYCNNDNCTLNGDRVCDTPPDGTHRASPCNSPYNTCNTDTLSNYSNGYFKQDVPDPIDNIMDMGFEKCQNAFTQGQADRMLAIISILRPGLLVSKNTLLCADSVLAGFQKNIVYPQKGDTVKFTNTSTGSANFEWFVNGVRIATTKDFIFPILQSGTFIIKMKASGVGNCFSTHTEKLIVGCGVTARFYADKQTVATHLTTNPDTIHFFNNSYGASNFKWLMTNENGANEQVVSTDQNLSRKFDLPGKYSIRLVASNGSCADTTVRYTVTVLEPTPDLAVYMSAVHCYEQTKIKVDFYICNWGFTTVPAKIPVQFYDANPALATAKKIGKTFYTTSSIKGFCCSEFYTQILDVGAPGLNELWIVVNDSGTSIPLQLPNTTIQEKTYQNNLAVSTNFQFKAIPKPDFVSLEPGDTITLRVTGNPTTIATYEWNNAKGLSCTDCAAPLYQADTSALDVKRIKAISTYGCYDSTEITIQVPPYHDFSIRIDSAECAGSDSIQVHFSMYNDFKHPILPKGLMVRFYRGNPLTDSAKWLPPAIVLKDSFNLKELQYAARIKAMPDGDLFAVINDSLGKVPIVFPNNSIKEKNYLNNTNLFNYRRLDANPTKLTGLIEPGDTILLEANAFPGVIQEYTWWPAYNLSCSSCRSPLLFADTTTPKMVMAENRYGCRDTAILDVQIPPSDDFTIQILETVCAAGDSMYVKFKAGNLFRRGFLPKGLTIRFFDKNPDQPGAKRLEPAFVLPYDVHRRDSVFSIFVQQSHSGSLYAAINDSGITYPIVFPNSRRLEKLYTNNIVSVKYKPDPLRLIAEDTAIIRGTSFVANILDQLDNPSSTVWKEGVGYSLSCTNCINPVIMATDTSVIPVQSANRFGCILNGQFLVSILPPDFTLSIAKTECINNTTTKVTFSICMNNGYDTVWKGIPVSFYEGNPALRGSKLLQTTFITSSMQKGNCYTFEHHITTPGINSLFGVVNDMGIAATQEADYFLPETNTGNNITEAARFKRFNVHITPRDTTIERSTSIPLLAVAEGGQIETVRWTMNTSLSCTDCIRSVVTPTYTDQYFLIAQNEYQCTDTASAIVRTISNNDFYIPTAFTPNGDRLNDIFYIIGGKRVKQLKDFVIFSRWGERIFEVHNVPPNDPQFGWNGLMRGAKAEAGTYVYQVVGQMEDGKTELRKGTINLIR